MARAGGGVHGFDPAPLQPYLSRGWPGRLHASLSDTVGTLGQGRTHGQGRTQGRRGVGLGDVQSSCPSPAGGLPA